LNGLLASAPGEQRRKTIYATTPLGRFGTADEIAAAAVFLASDDASYITGIEFSSETKNAPQRRSPFY
jgi:NAD(P)-dependent dehydrogenase (short-subunit alcohol dehydrogenase family)